MFSAPIFCVILLTSRSKSTNFASFKGEGSQIRGTFGGRVGQDETKPGNEACNGSTLIFRPQRPIGQLGGKVIVMHYKEKIIVCS